MLSVIILTPKMVHDWNNKEMVNFSSFDSFISRLDIKHEMSIMVSRDHMEETVIPYD